MGNTPTKQSNNPSLYEKGCSYFHQARKEVKEANYGTALKLYDQGIGTLKEAIKAQTSDPEMIRESLSKAYLEKGDVQRDFLKQFEAAKASYQVAEELGEPNAKVRLQSLLQVGRVTSMPPAYQAASEPLLPEKSLSKTESKESAKLSSDELAKSNPLEINSPLASDIQTLNKKLDEGLELDIPGSIAKKLQLLRKRILEDEDIQDELKQYIPVQGAYHIQDGKTFDLETKLQEIFSGDKKLILLIGNAGGGKSTFNRYIEHKLWEAYQPGDPIPLFVILPQVNHPEHRLMEQVLTRYGFTPKEIETLKKQHHFQLILDGYDEMNQMINLYDVNELEQWQAKVVITCRTQYLTPIAGYTKYFIPHQSQTGRDQARLFQEITVVPFSDKQISAYIKKYLELHPDAQWNDPIEYEKQIKTIPGLRDLIETPFLLMIAMEVMPRIVEQYLHLVGKERLSVTQANLYDAFIEKWFEREETKLLLRRELPSDGHDVKIDFWAFSKELGAAMHAVKLTHVRYVPSSAIILGSKKEKRVDPWEEYFGNHNPDIVRARRGSPLRKIGEHHYAFIHASLVEYFFTKKMYDETLEVAEEAQPRSSNSGINSSVGLGQLASTQGIFKGGSDSSGIEVQPSEKPSIIHN